MHGSEYPSCKNHPYAGFRLENQWGRCVCSKCGDHIGWVKPTDKSLLERPTCAGCGQTGSVHLMRTIQVNGNSLVKWHCEPCDKFISQSLHHPRVLQYLAYLHQRYPERSFPSTIEEIRTRYDYRESDPCFVCGKSEGTEYHHFMPQTFRHDPRVSPSWDQWEKCGVRLCQDCHQLWHQLVAPMDLLAGAATTEARHAK